MNARIGACRPLYQRLVNVVSRTWLFGSKFACSARSSRKLRGWAPRWGPGRATRCGLLETMWLPPCGDRSHPLSLTPLAAPPLNCGTGHFATVRSLLFSCCMKMLSRSHGNSGKAGPADGFHKPLHWPLCPTHNHKT